MVNFFGICDILVVGDMMKKINVLFIIVGIISFLVAGYIITDKILARNINVEIDEEKELGTANEYLAKIGSPLGWLIVKEGIDMQDDNGKYKPRYNYDYLNSIENKQLFTMEYILSYPDYMDEFVVLSAGDYKKIDVSPTDDFTIAYLDYNIFNKYYNQLFGKDFNIDKAKKGNTEYDKEYVYYDNRRPGSNGVYVSMITSDKVWYKNGEYIANVKVTYSTRLADIIGVSDSTGIVTYIKNSDNAIILRSFILEK